MLLNILLASILLGPCVILGYSEKEETLNNISKTSYLIDEAMNSSIILSDCNYKKGDLKRIIVSATRVLDFLQLNLDGLVIDAAIGTRIMESQLKLLRAGHPNMPQKLQELLITLQLKCKRLSDEIISKMTSRQLTTQERNQLVQNLKWVDDASLWERPSLGNWRPENEISTIPVVNNTMKDIKSQDEAMNEEISDKCTSDILQGCSVTDECSQLFMINIYSQYSLTHQLFFFQFAERKNCFNDENFKRKMGSRDPAKFMHLMCENIWREANDIQKSNFQIFERDLLAEQITVCSLMGYTQFLKFSWLENILSWQSDVGCYLEPSLEVTQDDGKRVKRSDNEVRIKDEKCSVHFTTVAFCAMAMHLRYLGDSCLKNY